MKKNFHNLCRICALIGYMHIGFVAQSINYLQFHGPVRQKPAKLLVVNDLTYSCFV